VLLPNVVDFGEFMPLEERLAVPFTVLGVGRHVAVKRYDRFLQILTRLRAGIPEARGVLVGDGPERAALERLAVELGISGAVEFAGEASATAESYMRASVLLVTSEHEGTSNVVLEAMASGLPVVALDAGGTSALVMSGETGYVHAQDDIDGAVRSLALLARAPCVAHRMGSAGWRHVMECHSRARLAEAFAGLLAMARARVRYLRGKSRRPARGREWRGSRR